MNLLKRIFEKYNGLKKSLILIAFATVVLFFFNYKGYFNVINSDFKEKQELFTYLKNVQPIENEFYALVGNLSHGDSKSKDILKEIEDSISIIDKLLKELINIKATDHGLENKLFFTQEINAIRKMLMEQSFWISHNDKVSLEKSKTYFDEYLMVSELRRDSLKSIFDTYKVQYIDLGNRIKYKIE